MSKNIYRVISIALLGLSAYSYVFKADKLSAIYCIGMAIFFLIVSKSDD